MLDYIPLLLYFKSKNEYSGAHLGMRYYFTMKKEKQPQPDGTEQEISLLAGTIWPEPWAREHTDPALQLHRDFPLTDEGRQQAAQWLSDTFYSDEEKWKVIPNILDCEPWNPAPPAEDDASAE